MSYEWIGCIDHLVELTTGIAFDGPGVKDVMAKCRRIVGHFSSSSQAQDTLLRQQLVTGTGTPLKVVQDVVTRWWSTYSMVERLLELRVSLHQLANIDDKIAEIMLSLQEWEIVKQMERILKPFMHIQRFFEGQTYVTISHVPYMIKTLRGILEGFSNNEETEDNDEDHNHIDLKVLELVQSHRLALAKKEIVQK